ncbi:MAG: hypothetical protein Q7S83_04265 [bacterium]|nr:hypothetical protein [bacterium]
MEKFIKENWFKVAIACAAILLGISTFYSFIILPLRNTQIAQQQKCADAAEKFFKDEEGTNSNIADYTSHWNLKLNKCFSEIQARVFSNGNFLTEKSLYDVFERKQYGSFSSMTPEVRGPVVCITLSDGSPGSRSTCGSEEEYDEFVESYMDN